MIKETIYEYWDKELPEVFPREVETDSSDLINDVVGIRRCGKTFMMFSKIRELLKKVNKKYTIYINFENRKLFPLNTNYFNEIIEFIHSEKLLENGKVYLFLDEVQKIDGWEKFVRSIYDEFKGKFKDYKIGKVLIEKDRANIKKFLEEYLTFGGFPEVVLSEENKEQILSQLFNDILSRDILSRNVRKESILEEFAYYLSGNVTSLLSFNKMSDYFKSRGIKVSVPTLESYFGLIKNSFLFFDNLIFSYKIKDQFQNPKKIYCIDNGIFNFIGLKFSKDYGKMYENSVFLKLKK